MNFVHAHPPIHIYRSDTFVQEEIEVAGMISIEAFFAQVRRSNCLCSPTVGYFKQKICILIGQCLPYERLECAVPAQPEPTVGEVHSIQTGQASALG